uniref:uncharacterized protein LOC124055060 isoform X1 n=1 Tax=Scatophagus argus TaxID=75038 RepID=UPI001ED7EBCE|nr:uncharacterized protein LOC124055060 isoform X1 [Scatophagus argus]
MARLSSTLILLLVVVGPGRGENLHIIVGDPVQFPDMCVPGESAELSRDKAEEGVWLVAQREQGVCKPVDDYKDRMDENSCFAFSRSLISDGGNYEITCGGQTHRVQLDVVFGSEVSVTEGEPLTVPCYKTCKQVDSVLWEKHGRVVVNHSLATGRTTYGTGFEGNVRLAPGGVKEGNWSLMFARARLEDEGDYFCSFLKGGVTEDRGDPAAARVKVTKRDRGQETSRLTPDTTQRVTDGSKDGLIAAVATLAVLLVILFSAVVWLGWKLLCMKAERLKTADPPSAIKEVLGRLLDIHLANDD